MKPSQKVWCNVKCYHLLTWRSALLLQTQIWMFSETPGCRSIFKAMGSTVITLVLIPVWHRHRDSIQIFSQPKISPNSHQPKMKCFVVSAAVITNSTALVCKCANCNFWKSIKCNRIFFSLSFPSSKLLLIYSTKQNLN